jgi:hypothetical protein
MEALQGALRRGAPVNAIVRCHARYDVSQQYSDVYGPARIALADGTTFDLAESHCRDLCEPRAAAFNAFVWPHCSELAPV